MHRHFYLNGKEGGHQSQKEIDRIDHGRRIWDKSTALVAISVNRVIYPTLTYVPNRMNTSSFLVNKGYFF